MKPAVRQGDDGQVGGGRAAGGYRKQVETLSDTTRIDYNGRAEHRQSDRATTAFSAGTSGSTGIHRESSRKEQEQNTPRVKVREGRRRNTRQSPSRPHHDSRPTANEYERKWGKGNGPGRNRRWGTGDERLPSPRRKTAILMGGRRQWAELPRTEAADARRHTHIDEERVAPCGAREENE